MSISSSTKFKIVCGVLTLLVTFALLIGSPILLISTILRKLTWQLIVLSIVLFIMGIVFLVISYVFLFSAGKELQKKR